MRARFAELVGALTLATDLAAGLAVETALRVCILAVELGKSLALPREELVQLHDAALLRFIGCTSFSHEMAKAGGGDDMGLLRDLTCVDPADKRDALGRIVTGVARDRDVFTRVRVVAGVLADAKAPEKLARAHCALAVVLGKKLGVDDAVVDALGHLYARYDGRGFPDAKGDGVALLARIVHVAFRAETVRNLEGGAAVVDDVKRRRGGELDPKIADVFIARAAELLALVEPASVWDRFLAAEPEPVRFVDDERVEEIAAAFAHYADAKSPFTLDHSPRVARIAAAAAAVLSIDADAAKRLHVACLLHDIGRCGVPNGIWDKRGALNVVERSRMREHAVLTERVLSTSTLLSPWARIASSDHERGDGSGYPRGSSTSSSPADRAASLLAAADVYAALTEDRPHRRAFKRDEAANVLVEEARGGRLDKACVDTVLAGAGVHVRARLRGEPPGGLSERELEVLLLVARGLQNKEIAQRLDISAKTVQHHVTHIYEKTRLQGRAAFAIWAIEHELLSG